MPARFLNIAQVKAANVSAGGNFFSPSTMRFFDSRVHDAVYGGRFFITSERYNAVTPRRYTVREASPGGHIKSASEFQAFAAAAEARKDAWERTLAIHPDDL